MNIYIAAPWDCREQARAFAARVSALGHDITEPWWDHTDTKNHDELSEQALRDLNGVIDADMLIVLNLHKSEGKAVETGIALGQDIAIVIVGERSNIFHHLPEVFVTPTEDTALATLAEYPVATAPTAP